jgi:hypothetical protein
MRRREATLADAAPISDKPGTDRATRAAVTRSRKGKEAAKFATRQAFDQAIASVIKTFPDTPDVA